MHKKLRKKKKEREERDKESYKYDVSRKMDSILFRQALTLSDGAGEAGPKSHKTSYIRRGVPSTFSNSRHIVSLPHNLSLVHSVFNPL